MLDVAARGRDVRAFVCSLEDWVIATLAEFGVTGERRKGRVGVWVKRPDRPPMPDGTTREDKIGGNWHQAEEMDQFPRHLDQRRT